MNNFSIIFPGNNIYDLSFFKNFYDNSILIREIIKKSSNILKYDILKNIQQKNEKKQYLNIFVISIAMFYLWKKNTYKIPKIMSGHSLGQYTALVCSGIMDLSDALITIKYREKLMKQEEKKIKPLMLIIIGLKKKIIKKICYKLSKNSIDYVSISHINTKTQIVISGNYEITKKAGTICKKKGAKYVLKKNIKRCPHILLMKKIKEKFSNFLQNKKFYLGKIQVIENVSASFIPIDKKKIIKLLTQHIYKPVLWYKTIKKMQKYNVNTLIEIGPGKILTNMFLQDKQITALSTNSIKNFFNAILHIER